MDPVEWSLIEARAALAARKLSCAEYVDLLLARSSACANLNAWVTRDEDALRRDARMSDESAKAQDSTIALAGLPIALKDNIDTNALPTSGGTRALQGRVPKRNAPVAQTLFDQGALLAGKTNMHELAFGITTNNYVTGAARNPWNRLLIPGGSSGGSAVAVASRMVPAALGTDTGASVRLPAALCGIVGFRPTVGRYSGAGVVPISHTRDTVGTITRNVEDAALLDGILAANDRRESPPLIAASLSEVRLGIPRDYFFANLDPAVQVVVERALSRLSGCGATLVEVEIISIGALNEAVGFPVALYELQHDLPAYLDGHEYGLTLADIAAQVGSPDVAGVLNSQLGDLAMPLHAYEAGLVARTRLQAAYAECFSGNRIDALIFPTSILPARPIGDDETVTLNGERVPTFATYIHNTDPGSNAGIPGISIPAGLTSDDLPVGLELDGLFGGDRHLLAVAAAIETVLPRLRAPRL